MKTTLAIVTLSSLLSACAGIAPTGANNAAGDDGSNTSVSTDGLTVTNVTVPNRNSKTAKRGKTAPNEDVLPSVTLTDELIFKILSAEIAFQRGDWQTGYIAELSAAQQTRDPRLARRAAEIAVSGKRIPEALSAVRLWRELAPNSDEATQYFVGFVLLGDNIEEVRPILTKRLADARPLTRPVVILQTQRMLAGAKNKEAAFVLLEALVAPYSGLSETHIALAQNAFLKGDKERASSEVRTALSIKPNSEIAVLTLAQISQDKDAAGKILNEFLVTYPKSIEVRKAYARSLVEQKEYEKARDQFQQLLELQPEDLTNLYALGMLDVQTNNYADAEKYLGIYLKQLATKPDDDRDPSQAILVLAQIAEERNDPETALKLLSQIESGDALIGAQVKRAQIVAKQGNLAEARHLLQQIKPEEEREKTLVILAESQILRDADQGSTAFALLEDALKRYPDNTDLLYDYAMVAEKANNLVVMEKALRRVIVLAPTNQNAYNALGYSFAERNIRLQEADVLVQKAAALAPDDPYIMDSLGWVQFRLGKLKEAEDLLRRAYAARPDAEIAVHLGEVLWVKGQKADAEKVWRDARAKDPKNDTLKSTLARLRINL